MAVTGEVEEDGLGFAIVLGGQASSMAARMAWAVLGRRHDALGLREELGRGEHLGLGQATASIMPSW